jgi:hypothetical protein
MPATEHGREVLHRGTPRPSEITSNMYEVIEAVMAELEPDEVYLLVPIVQDMIENRMILSVEQIKR